MPRPEPTPDHIKEVEEVEELAIAFWQHHTVCENGCTEAGDICKLGRKKADQYLSVTDRIAREQLDIELAHARIILPKKEVN